MSNLVQSLIAAVKDPLFLAGVVTVVGFFGSRFRRTKKPMVHFAIQFVVFAVMTGLMLAGGVMPYRGGRVIGDEPRRLFAATLEVVWWLVGAWFVVGFLRAFVVLGRQPHQSKLVQDLLAAVTYVAAIFAIVADVFDLPLKGLLATSGVVAVVVGLALQSSLGDIFSGIVLNIERPYRVGDWIILDDNVQGKVIETNWRATHILTDKQDVASIPNSVIAKSRLVNCSTPTKTHGATTRVKLAPSLTPAAGRNLLREVLLASAHVLRTPEPTIAIKDLSAEMIDYELTYAVADISLVDLAQNDLFDRIFSAATSSGTKFSPRFAAARVDALPNDKEPLSVPERLVEGIALFSTLTGEEKAFLASKMERKVFSPGDLIVKAGTILQALSIVSRGVLVTSIDEGGRKIEVARLTRGTFFGENGLLTGEPLNGEVNAVTRVVIYEISKDALSPLLKARPGMAEELSESLARRRLTQQAVLTHTHEESRHEEGLAKRAAANIRRVFAIH